MSLTLLGLPGCNQIGLAFKWVDTYIASKVDDYFDINSQQSRELKSGIQKDLRQVKSQVLPQWIERLKELESEVKAGPLNPQKTALYFELFMRDIEHISSRFQETARGFIANTQPQQLAYFAKAYRKKALEDLIRYQKKEKYRKELRSKYIEYTRMFLGPLTATQTHLIESHLDATPFPSELKSKNKDHILQEYLKVGNSPQAQRDFLNRYYSNPEFLDLPQYRAALALYQQGLQKLVADLLASLTHEQKLNLIESLREKTLQLEQIARN